MTEPNRCRTATTWIPAPPQRVYSVITDVAATATSSSEVQDITWTTRRRAEAVSVGDTFTAVNARGGVTWTSVSTVTAAEEGTRFGFTVGNPERATAVWTYQLRPDRDGTCLSYSVQRGPGPSMIASFFDADSAARGEQLRLDLLLRDMAATLEYVKAACTQPRSRDSADPG